MLSLSFPLTNKDNMAVFVNNFEIPSWAGKPPTGLHLDVLKDTKMIQKLMIDEKKCYFFGRNKQLCDFCIDHQSCSRVHAVLVWHKHLNRPFIIDLKSTHGTFIGTLRLEGDKPQQVPLDSELHFGASTRRYIIRERPQTVTQNQGLDEKGENREEIEGGFLGLPESETELDNLTEFNTAHNRRIAAMPELTDVNPLKRKRKNSHVHFNEDEEVINPEDIDPSIGRFRNMVSTTVIPRKKPRTDDNLNNPTDSLSKRMQHLPYQSHLVYHDSESGSGGGLLDNFSFAAKLGLRMPNLAPDVDEVEPPVPVVPVNPIPQPLYPLEESGNPLEPKKKKYAKEAWPGKKPTPSLLV